MSLVCIKFREKTGGKWHHVFLDEENSYEDIDRQLMNLKDFEYNYSLEFRKMEWAYEYPTGKLIEDHIEATTADLDRLFKHAQGLRQYAKENDLTIFTGKQKK